MKTKTNGSKTNGKGKATATASNGKAKAAASSRANRGEASERVDKAITYTFKPLKQIAAEAKCGASFVARVIKMRKIAVKKRPVEGHKGVGRRPIEIRRYKADHE